MPYINRDRREALDPVMAELAESISTAGEMNYTITRLIHKWIADYGECYDAYNSMIGVLECAKAELYRRKVAKYEDEKIKTHGDLL